MQSTTGEHVAIPDGTGQEGSFLGLPPELTGLERASVAILPVPFDLTTSYQKGSDQGPQALIDASRSMEVYDIETASEVCQLGIHTCAPVVAESSTSMLARVHDETARLLSMSKFVVTLGGEHSISYAPIRAHADHYGPIGILHLDAHADMRDSYEGDPHSHACVIARVVELEQVETVVSVGIRSMSTEERGRCSKVRYHFDHQLQQQPDWIDRVLSQLPARVYATIDLDVLDPAIMPSTGTPEPGGLGWYELLSLLRRVCSERELIGFDVVELCPGSNPAPDFLAAKLVYKLLSYRFADIYRSAGGEKR